MAQGQLREGSYVYKLEADGFIPSSDTLDFVAGQGAIYDTLTHEYYKLEIQCIHELSLEPIADARVNFAGKVQLTNMEGKVYEDSLIYREYALNVEADGFVSIENQPLSMDRDRSIQLKLSPQPYPQKLVVLNQWNQSPVSGAAISIRDQRKSSEKNGEVLFDLAPGAHEVKIEKEKYANETFTIETHWDSTHYFQLFQELADVQFRIKGSGSALVGAQIYLAGDTLVSGAGGLASAYKLEVDSTYTFMIQDEGYSPYSDQLILHTDSLLQIYMNLVAVEKNPGLEQVSIFPNPFQSEFTIQGLGKTDYLSISDLRGKVFLTRSIEGPEVQLDLSAFPKGIYILQLKKSGVTRKLISE